MQHLIRRILTRLGEWSAHPIAFAIVLVYAVVWFFVERETLDFHGFATLATWLMTLVITRAEYRDTKAIHAKLDELLSSHGEEKTEIKKLDEREPEEVDEHREGASSRGDWKSA